MKYRILLVAALMAAALVTASAAFAYSVDGYTHHASGATWPGSHVDIINENTNAVGSTTSDGAGHYVFSGLVAGYTYEMEQGNYLSGVGWCYGSWTSWRQPSYNVFIQLYGC